MQAAPSWGACRGRRDFPDCREPDGGSPNQLAELVTAGATLLTLVLLAPDGLDAPGHPGGSVIVYSVGLIELAGFRGILEIRRLEFVWALVALLGVVLLGTLQGILVAIVLSVLALAQQVANPRCTCWAGSLAPMSSGPPRTITPRTRRSPVCCCSE